MADSILQRGRYCYLCGREKCGGEYIALERHHVMNGNPNRKKAEQYGLWVYLCPPCHRKVHAEFALRYHLKQTAQREAMKTYGWNFDDFRRIFGKNYL